MKLLFLPVLALVGLTFPTLVQADGSASPYAKWTQGPPTDPNYFPLSVWCQSPRNADKLHAAGINTYVALSGDVTDANLAALKSAGVKLICEQNVETLKHIGDPTIIGWMHGDEPDNAQSLPGGKGYGPPILPQTIIDGYNAAVKADPTRPIMLNLDLSVAYNEWGGRGTRSGHAEDYPEYIKGSDIVSFDIYPVAGAPAPVVQDQLWYVAKGVDHLVKLADGHKVVWNCIETSHISTKDKIATPAQVRSEVWMSLIHGSMGIIYFLHEFTPFKEAAILENPEMLAGVTALNKQITSLAPELNSPTVTSGSMQADNAQAQVDFMTKNVAGTTYVFAVEMRNASTKATLTLPGLKGDSKVTVIDENRTVDAKDGVFTDTFAPYDVHLYKITATP